MRRLSNSSGLVGFKVSSQPLAVEIPHFEQEATLFWMDVCFDGRQKDHDSSRDAMHRRNAIWRSGDLLDHGYQPYYALLASLRRYPFFLSPHLILSLKGEGLQRSYFSGRQIPSSSEYRELARLRRLLCCGGDCCGGDGQTWFLDWDDFPQHVANLGVWSIYQLEQSVDVMNDC